MTGVQTCALPICKIYWTEDNTQYQDIYGTLNGMISFRKGIMNLGFRADNITNEKYKTFYFESLGNKLGQYGAPFTFGVDLSLRF